MFYARTLTFGIRVRIPSVQVHGRFIFDSFLAAFYLRAAIAIPSLSPLFFYLIAVPLAFDSFSFAFLPDPSPSAAKATGNGWFAGGGVR